MKTGIYYPCNPMEEGLMTKEKQAEILLAAVITARATSFIFAK